MASSKTATVEIDETDQAILRILGENGRLSYRKIAQRIGKTEATVRRRVKKMIRETGVIDHFTVIVDKTFDKPIKAIVTIAPELNARKRIAHEIMDLPEMTDVALLSGKCGIWCRAEVDSMAEFRELIDTKLSAIQGIQDLETCFVMKDLKLKYHS